MSIYKNYFDVKILTNKLEKKIEQNPDKVADTFRRVISIGVNSLHQIAKKKSIGGYAIAMLESDIKIPDGKDVRVQSVIRIFTKKESSLKHIRSIIVSVRYFMDFFDIGVEKVVEEHVEGYYAFIRVRMPTIKKNPESVLIKKQKLNQSPDCNFIYLMPSSSIKGNKRLIRYYYKIVSIESMKPAQYSKPDGYGFSRTNRMCGLAAF